MRQTFLMKFAMLLSIALGCINNVFCQNKKTTIVNYDFNSGTSYASFTPILAAGITSTSSSTAGFATSGGTATGAGAFNVNATAGNAVTMSNSSGNNTSYFQFQIGGSSLKDYFNYKIYCQAQRSTNGAQVVTLSYSVDGVNYTNAIQTGAPGNGSFVENTFDLSSLTVLNNQSIIYFKLSLSGGSGSNGTFRLDNFQIQAEAQPKHYRTKVSGDWNSLNTWESSADNIAWNAALMVPSFQDKTITLLDVHTVIVSSSVSMDEMILAGNLQVATGGIITINDGTGIDLDIKNKGVLQMLSTNAYTATVIINSSVINIATGGKILVGDGTMAVGAGYESFATSTVNLWNDGSIFEWNTPTNFSFSSTVYFPAAAATVIPIFTVTKVTGPIMGTGAAILNGLLKLNGNLTLGGNGLKTLRDGITGTATLTLNASTEGYNISSPTAIISGTVSIILNKDLRLAAGVTIPLGSSVNISGVAPNNIAKGSGGIFLINGIVDMNTTSITNATGNITVKGTLRTANANGLYGTGATIVNGSVLLNTNSTIEYYAGVAQIVQGATVPSYYNVTFSGNSRKTLVSNNTPLGTVSILGSTIFDAANFTFGDVGTNVTMTGTSRFITGGSNTKPDAQGTYNLAPATTIEFALSSGTIVRLGNIPINYANVIISGTNVLNVSKTAGLLFQPGGSFTVKTGGVFKLENPSGFTGSNVTAISNANNPTIILEDGSTIEYSGTTAQSITSQTGLPYKNLALSGSGNKTAPAGTLTVSGNITKAGTANFIHNKGTVLLNGSNPQSFAGLIYNNLIMTNNTKTTGGNSIIMDSIKINAGTILLVADDITLHSDATTTSRMGIVDGNISYGAAGKFIVERYISARRAWRFLSIPVNSIQTIKQAWQEGAASKIQNPKPNYGTQITSNKPSWKADGFDTISVSPSMKTYNATNDNYVSIPSTLSTFEPAAGGYMTFIRGDRTAVSIGSTITSTTLRSSGKLFTGDQPLIKVTSGKFTPVNNPYASALDLRKISKSSRLNYYVFDPNSGGGYGYGAFQTLFYNGADYDVVPSGGSYGAINNYIESGQAFFVSTSGADTTLQLSENAKAISTATLTPFVPVTFSGKKLRTNLLAVNNDGTTELMDGVLHNFEEDYSADQKNYGAQKLQNFGENLSIKNNEQLLSIQRRELITGNDTLFLNITGLKKQPYQLQFIPENLIDGVLKAFLSDNYSKTNTRLSLNGLSTVNFSINDDAASFAADRFYVLFEKETATLPVNFISLKGWRSLDSIRVEWKTENESQIKVYEVEKSTDGTMFMVAGSVKAINLNRNTYNWVDKSFMEENQFYRIKSIALSGDVKYSGIVKVSRINNLPEIAIYPNPVKNKMVNLQFSHQPAGKYYVRLINKLGQVIIAQAMMHDEINANEILIIKNKLSHGIYRLEVTSPNNTVTNLTVLCE